MIDTLRADALGCYGSDLGTSPEIDALAARGVRFANVFSPASWTRPAVGAMLTGRHPRSLGIYAERYGILDDRFSTLAERLRSHGYATFGVTANPHLNTSYNFQQGFDTYIDSSAVYPFMQHAQDDEPYKESTVRSGPEMFDQALQFLEARDGQPVYLQIALMEVHEWSRADEHTLTRPEYRSLFDGVPSARYFAALRQLSADLGAFVDQVRARPGWEDALFVFVSDHGEGLRDHPHVARSSSHGHLLYESQLRVPLLFYREGWSHSGRVVERPVRLLDLVPTVLDIVGLEVPSDLEGISLAPLLRDPETRLPLPDYFVAETELRDNRKVSVYGDDWKYFEHYDAHPGTAPRELQEMGRPEDGVRTNRLDSRKSTADAMANFLEEWKRTHPRAEATPHAQELTEREIRQLESIGYLQ
jgi:arylsulfatase A-like enzyme